MLTDDAINVAACLQTAAEPWQIVVGPAAYAATKRGQGLVIRHPWPSVVRIS
jgi:class 3 adenylate cyclase